MLPDNRTRLEQRVVNAAEEALRHKKYISPIDVLVGIGWLPPTNVDMWRQGRLPYLERGATANLRKLSTAMHLFRSWAMRRGLKPSETSYVARTRERRPLQFSASGQEDVERWYRTHWISPELSERKRERLAERQSKAPDLVVISPRKEWTCSRCRGSGDFLLMEDTGPICLVCAGLNHLEFLPAGDSTVTRRAKQVSRLSAVVVRWSRTRKRYERQGILAEKEAIERAESQPLANASPR